MPTRSGLVDGGDGPGASARVEPRFSHLVTRRALEVAASHLAVEPVVALQGPRAVGWSTLLQQLAREFGADIEVHRCQGT